MKTLSVHKCENCKKMVDVTASISKGQFYEVCPYCNTRFKLHSKEIEEYMVSSKIKSADDINRLADSEDMKNWVKKEMTEISKIN